MYNRQSAYRSYGVEITDKNRYNDRRSLVDSAVSRKRFGISSEVDGPIIERSSNRVPNTSENNANGFQTTVVGRRTRRRIAKRGRRYFREERARGNVK